jgi:hypothetical protein
MTLLVFLGLSVFVVDYGVLWVGREQAQNAADAGAIAGAISQAYDDPSVIGESVSRIVAANPVWFDPEDPEATSSTVLLECPAEAIAGTSCVKVGVYRDGSNGSGSLPMFFAPVLGITSQGVRATATAQVAVGNGTTCLKPWAIPDKWVEGSAPPNGDFERWDGAGAVIMNPDTYVPPTADPPGGLAFPADLGRSITLSFPDPDDPGKPTISEGFLLPLVLPGANTYEENIAGCNGQLVEFGQEIGTGTPAMSLTTPAHFAELFALDPDASWNPGTRNVNGSCAPGCAPISPRLVALAVFDVDEYQFSRATGDWDCDVGGGAGGTGRCVNVMNIVGFFIEDVAGGVVTGRVARYPGLVWPDSPTPSAASSFLPAIILVR